MNKTAEAEPRGPLAGVSLKAKKKAGAVKAQEMEEPKTSGFGVSPELQAADGKPAIARQGGAPTKLREPPPKRRRSSTASSRRSSPSLPPEDGQRSPLCEAC